MFDKKLITSKDELLEYSGDIAELFQKCFNDKPSKELWQWAYIDNVCGEPIVSLYYHDQNLIGHYAVIPMRLYCNGKNILAALSMTTMVDMDYRRHGLFMKQANEVYDKAKELGFSLVYGFPNKQSAPGFRKRLGWIINNQSYVSKIQGRDLINKNFTFSNQISFNHKDEELLAWRLSKPNQEYFRNGSLIMKKFENDVDIVFHQNDFTGLKQENYYNLLVDESDNYKSEKMFDYAFGYRIFDEKLINFQLKKDLIMSDIF